MTERKDLLRESLLAIERMQARLDASERARHEPIAIVGAGCRYPGGIETPEALWRFVRDGQDAVAEVPAQRWDIDAYYSPAPDTPGKMITRRGGFLSQVDHFDPQFFGISPREAGSMDPQQRLLLETAWEAIETAGIAADGLVGSSTGVFVGITTNEYGELLRRRDPGQSDVYAATGNALNAAAGRIAFTFGFQGPCAAVDTACSSSLVAVHLACQSLRNGESNLALAGGVNVVLSPDAMVLFSHWGMLAPDGACKTFDAGADGFVRSEGCAVIALQRLSDALADGSPILAVIRGSAVNSDGRSSGLTVPNGIAQQALLRTALAHAGLQPGDVDYVEAHGTGTPLGDPIEVEALGAVMGDGRTADNPLLMGSIKTNLGHTEAASGLAGLLKTVMALRHEAIPPHLHFSTRNPGIRWADLPVAVPVVLTPWPRNAIPRRAGVSSFGFSGTNAHVLLEEAPPPSDPAAEEPGPYLLPVSARDDTALRELAGRYAARLAEDPALSVAEIAATAAIGRSHLRQRLVLLATDAKDELERGLRDVAAGQTPRNAFSGAVRIGERPKIAFLFTGQGAQYPGMGRGLYDTEPAFRSALDHAAKLLAPHLDRPLLELMFPAIPGDAALSQTGYTQPAMFALQYALVELWRSWGITPSLVLGHSVGEYAAAHTAGVFSLEDGLALIAARGRMMQQLPAGGGMAAVFADEARVAAALAEWGDRLAIAAINGPEETVVSGDIDALARCATMLSQAGIQSRMLEVSHAFHSPRLDPMLHDLQHRAGSIRQSEPRIPFLSNLTGALWQPGMAPDAMYWRRHAREPVRFAQNLAALRAAGITTLVEIGPHPTLIALAERAMPAERWTALASLRRARDDRREMMTSLGQLYVRGAPVRWQAVVGTRPLRRAVLPTYPFQRERHWALDGTPPLVGQQAGHPLLGEPHELAATPGTYVWEREISFDRHPWLRDHCVQGHAIVPASAYIEMAFAAGERLGAGPLVLRRLENLRPIILRDGIRYVIQASLVISQDGGASFAVHGRAAPTAERPGASPARWVNHMTAQIALEAAPGDDPPGLAILEQARQRCRVEQKGSRFYAALAQKGNEWGPSFQGVDRVWIGDDETVGRVRAPPTIAPETAQYRFHPALSDACGHILVALTKGDGAFVGQGVDSVQFHRSPGAADALWVHARLRPQSDAPGNVAIGDLDVYDDAGHRISQTRGVRLQYLDSGSGADPSKTNDDWLHAIKWHPQVIGAPGLRAARGSWLVFADSTGLADQIARHRDASQNTILVTPGAQWSCGDGRATIRPDHREDYLRLIATAGPASAILHLWSLDPTHELDQGSTAGLAALSRGPESLLHLLHALQGAPAGARPRIWLVTCNAQAVAEHDTCAAPLGAALWGMGKSLCAEHPGLWGGLVDVDDHRSVDTAECLVREVEAGTAEDKLAFRGGHRHVARLVRRDHLSQPTATFTVRGDGAYLITGGLGGIGLAVARWLVERGARHLLLIGRTPLPPRQAWDGLAPNSLAARRAHAVIEMEALGATVETVACDVAVEGDLERHLQARRTPGAPPICGVFHCAGSLELQPLATQDVESLRRGLAAKVAGTLRLHRLLREHPLDCFVLFSSTSALLNSPLLGSYAAGNAFLDAFAHYRRAHGLPALSINWGTWGDVGMVLDAAVEATGKLLRGVDVIPTASGLAVLGRLLDAGETQVGVMPIDWQEFAQAYPEFASDPFLETLVASDAHAEHPSAASSLASLSTASSEQRIELVAAYLRNEAARVLGIASDRFDVTLPLSAYGLDSLMAVQLKNRIEADLGAVLPIIRLLHGPSVEELVPAVLDAAPMVAPAAPDPEAAVVWEDGTL